MTMRTVFLLYAVMFLVALPWFHYILGPDAVSYLSIAGHYADGRWQEAVNTIWGPLFSWMLAPMVRAGLPAILGGKLLCGLSGGLVLLAVRLWAERFGLRAAAMRWTMAAASVMVASYALLRLGPDLLLAAWLLLYLYIVLDEDYALRPNAGVWCGLLGALLYFTKAYGFFFFIGHFALITAAHALVGRAGARGALLRHLATGLAVFTLVSAPWLLAVSAKAGRLTPAATGDWNYRLIGPNSPGYVQLGRMIAPPGPHAISMWEEADPKLLPRWSPLGSAGALRHQMRLAAGNLKDLISTAQEVSLLSAAVVLGFALLALSGRWGGSHSWLLLLCSLLTYTAGYLLVMVQDRYLWGCFLMILLLGMQTADRIDATGALGTRAGGLLVAAVAISFIALPVRQCIAQRNGGRDIYRISQDVARYAVGGNIAACERWGDSLVLSYFLGWRFHGTTGRNGEEIGFNRRLNPDLEPQTVGPAAPDEVIARQLADHQIDYFLAWSSCQSLPGFLERYPVISSAQLPDLRIYRLREPPRQ